MDAVSVLLFTAPSAEEAARIGKTLVEEGLAACVNVVPAVRSIYRWEGKLCDEGEALGIVKAPKDRVEALTARIQALHGAQVPEVIALDVSGGSRDYLNWVAANSSVLK